MRSTCGSGADCKLGMELKELQDKNKVFWEFLQSRAGESEENGSGVDEGEVVGVEEAVGKA